MDENSNLKLETESIKERIGVRSSLTDINQISVFTDAFEVLIEEKELREQKDKQELNAQMFVEELLNTDKNGIIGNLFMTKTEELIIRNEQQEVDDFKSPTMISSLIMVAAFVFGIVCFWGAKGKPKNDVNNKFEEFGRR